MEARNGRIDQAFQPGLGAGMVRCYMAQDRVVGFSEQAPRGSSTTAPALGMNSSKAMHGPDAGKFAELRATMESDRVLLPELGCPAGRVE